MTERSLGETYNRSYIAIPITESPLFKWVQDINGHKKFYHITLYFLGSIGHREFERVREVVSSLPKAEAECGLVIDPEKLDFIGEKENVFVVKIDKTDELSEIRNTLETKLPQYQGINHSFLPHITIQEAKRGNFDKFDRNALAEIPDKCKSVDEYFAKSIGVYYRTEEGATALLYSKKI